MAENKELDVLSETSMLSDSSGQVAPKEGNSDQCKAAKKKNRLQELKLRAKDPFNKKKISEMKRRECVLVKAIDRLSRCLLDMINNHPRGATVLGSIGNLQIDCINNIHNNSEDDFDEKQKAIDNLTNATNKLLQEITAENETRKKENAELTIRYIRSETKLEEIKDIVIQCSSKISQHDINHVQALKDLKDLQEVLVTDTADDKIASDGICAIRLSYIFDDEYDFLPFKTKLLVTRLLHLFGVDGLESLCRALKIEISDDILEACKHYGNKGSLKLLLNREVCAKILVDWVKKSVDNDGPALFKVIKEHESQRYEGKCCLHEDFYVWQARQDDDMTQYQPDIILEDNHDNSSSSEKSLSFDDKYFEYDSLERKCKQFLKLASVEGLSA